MPISRNAPCPCGSGKKYKKCCYPKGVTAFPGAQAAGSAPVPASAQEQDAKNMEYPMDYPLEDQAFMLEMLNKMRGFMLKNKPHIKAYYKLRDLHSEIVNAMAQYDADGKFEKIVQGRAPNSLPQQGPGPAAPPAHNGPGEAVFLMNSEFDMNQQAGAQAYYDLQIYKTAPNMNCLTEEFIQKNRYRRQDKIDFLHCMLHAKLGLFEVTGVDADEGYAYLQDIFTKERFTVTDVALSGNPNTGGHYLYTRIICCNGICFNTGLNLVFSKTDKFIQKHIRQHSKKFNPDTEFLRFMQLYNYYSNSSDRVEVMTNSI